ncbi:hypothetical protein NDN16_15540 [Aureimonas altamirensis]|uniref:hypothetical protein n=1 Tax=Aureimonas altamirensis TaxID=370622 RepID=UPI002036B48D|nr:hypothetical protein [Aureimonas altamirensis]MCM2505083.1 hypothetical protein [Aureimonas altamirensis]
MIDAAPALFRTLEKPQGAQSIDTVALAAISAFSAIERPSRRQAEDFTRLVLSSWPRLSDPARRQVAGALSGMDNSPVSIEALAAELPARPQAASAPLLGLVRRTQLRLADTGAQACPTASPAVQAVAEAALKGQSDKAFDRLSEAYGLSQGRRPDFTGDSDGHMIAMALKGLKASPGDALAILMMLRPEFSGNVQALDAFAAAYRKLDSDECRQKLKAEYRQPEEKAFGRLREPSADAPARSHFGKRRQRPDTPVSQPRQA